MRSLLAMILTFALTLALSPSGRAETGGESCINVTVDVSVTVDVDVTVNVTLDADGGVTLAWETGTEPDTAGYNVHRANAKGPYAKLNDAPIPAQGDPVSGGRYTFKDRPGNGKAYYYMLESISPYGKRKHQALVSVSTVHDKK